MQKDILVKDFMKMLNDKMSELVGQSTKGVTFVELANAQLNKFVHDYREEYDDWSVDVFHRYMLSIFVAGENEEVPFVEIHVTYNPDARTRTGEGDKIKTVMAKFYAQGIEIEDIPEDTLMIDLPQVLEFIIAKRRFERVYEQQKELEEKIAENRETMLKLQRQMRSSAYNKETERFANNAFDKAWEIKTK